VFFFAGSPADSPLLLLRGFVIPADECGRPCHLRCSLFFFSDSGPCCLSRASFLEAPFRFMALADGLPAFFSAPPVSPWPLVLSVLHAPCLFLFTYALLRQASASGLKRCVTSCVFCDFFFQLPSSRLFFSCPPSVPGGTSFLSGPTSFFFFFCAGLLWAQL